MQFENSLRHSDNSLCVEYLNGRRDFTPEQLQQIGDEMAATARQYGIDVDKIVIYADAGDGLYGLYLPSADGKPSYVALNTLDGDGELLGGEERAQRLHLELTHPNGGASEDFADYMGSYGKDVHDLTNFLYGTDYPSGGISGVDWSEMHIDNPIMADAKRLVEEAKKSGNAKFDTYMTVEDFLAFHPEAASPEYLPQAAATYFGTMDYYASLLSAGAVKMDFSEAYIQLYGQEAYDAHYKEHFEEGQTVAKVSVAIAGVTYATRALIAEAKELLSSKNQPSPISYTTDNKIEGQMQKRGWTHDDVKDTLINPSKTMNARDTRHDPNTGIPRNEPATGYISKDGGYVIVNNKTGEIVQVSNRFKHDWKNPWD